MKRMTFACVVALCLFAWAAPAARAQSYSSDMATAEQKYTNAMNWSYKAYNACAAGSANATNAANAYWCFNNSITATQNSDYYYSIGDDFNAENAAQAAIDWSHSGQLFLDKIKSGNPTAYSDAQYGKTAATRGDAIMWSWWYLENPSNPGGA
jgi:hypothetical protein